MLIQWTHDLADQPSATWPACVMLDGYGRPYRIDSDGQKVFINYGDWLMLAPQIVRQSETERKRRNDDDDD